MDYNFLIHITGNVVDWQKLRRVLLPAEEVAEEEYRTTGGLNLIYYYYCWRNTRVVDVF